MVRHLFVACFALALSAARGAAQADQPYPLLELTREWAAASPLGDLRTEPFSDDDLELRYWQGYGLVGTRGIILRRHSGRWDMRLATVHTCQVYLPTAVGDTLSAPSVAEYQKWARENCGKSTMGALTSARVIWVDTIALSPAPYPEPAALWERLKNEGLLHLEHQVPPGGVTEDGHTWVIEAREGNRYRAVEIEWRPGALDSAQAFAMRLGNRLGARTPR